MIPIEDFQYYMGTERYELAGETLVKIINRAIGHVNDRPVLEIKKYSGNWTTAPFHYMVLCPNDTIGIW